MGAEHDLLFTNIVYLTETKHPGWIHVPDIESHRLCHRQTGYQRDKDYI